MDLVLATLQKRLLAHAMRRGALAFGNFTTKAGRKSPYFFNSADMADGEGLDLIGHSYAAVITLSGLQFDVLYGAAYKGIPLANVIAASLWQSCGTNVGVSYNRKEPKNHGEGEDFVGADIKGKRVLIADDALSAGTAVRESFSIIRRHGDKKTIVTGIVLILDRQERGTGELSAKQEIEETYEIPVLSILTLDDVISFIENGHGDSVFHEARQHMSAVREYRERYGPAA